MIKLFLTAAFLLNLMVMAFANEPAKLKYGTVKMYRQPATKAQVIKTLTPADEVIFVRKFDAKWCIVTVNGEAGYVATNSLKFLPAAEKTAK